MVHDARAGNAGEVRPAREQPPRVRFRLVGVGAMRSPRYEPAGLLVLAPSGAVLLDAGPGAVRHLVPAGHPRAWLVTDTRSELVAAIRRAARGLGLAPEVASLVTPGLVVEPHPVEHTGHETWGYLLRADGRSVVWAPEYWRFPAWAAGADLMFADAAGWSRPIRFRGGVGGHAAVLDTAEQARSAGVRRLVLAHIGRPSIRALDSGAVPPYGEVGVEGRDYTV